MADIEWHDLNLDSEMEWLDYKRHSNHYETLEVSPNASTDVIKKVYKLLVEKYHPDKHPANRQAWAEEMTKDINEAFGVLSDDRKRKEYDEQRQRER